MSNTGWRQEEGVPPTWGWWKSGGGGPSTTEKQARDWEEGRKKEEKLWGGRARECSSPEHPPRPNLRAPNPPCALRSRLHTTNWRQATLHAGASGSSGTSGGACARAPSGERRAEGQLPASPPGPPHSRASLSRRRPE